jgi:two-component system sensor histidine kinase RegB
MRFLKDSNLYSLNKSTYVNLRWIAYLGQLSAILTVQFLLNFKFNYILSSLIVFLSLLTNLYLKFRVKKNQLNNSFSTLFLAFDIFQLGLLFFLTGGITNPFIFLIIVPAVFSSQYLNIYSSITLVLLVTLILSILTFFYFELPHPGELHFHAPNYYLYAIPLSIIIGLLFLVYFGFKFGEENRMRQKAYDKIQEIMAKENELVSLGGQAAAAAHSLGTPLSTIMLTAKEIQKELGVETKFKKDIDLLISQSNRCGEILKKLSINPKINDDFLDANVDLYEYINEIIRSYKEISNKKFVFNADNHRNPIKIPKLQEIIYGLRNFIGNANKFSKNQINIFLTSDTKDTEVIIQDDGPGFPKDLIEKNKLGEPYIRSVDQDSISKHGLGLGTFIGKTLLEKNYANITFENTKDKVGAEVIIKWKNRDLKQI